MTRLGRFLAAVGVLAGGLVLAVLAVLIGAVLAAGLVLAVLW